MGMYAQQEISLNNYDNTLGASPFGLYPNSIVIFPIAHTQPYINNNIYLNHINVNLQCVEEIVVML